MPHTDPSAAQRYNREYKRRNRWRYQARQKLYDAAKHANERAEQYGRPGRITPEDVERLFAGGRCHYCGESAPLTVDHRIGLHDPRSTNTVDNLVPACLPCNISKHQADRPNRWARKHDACVECGTTDRKHISHGRCSRCYWREYEAAHPDRRRRIVNDLRGPRVGSK